MLGMGCYWITSTSYEKHDGIIRVNTLNAIRKSLMHTLNILNNRKTGVFNQFGETIIN